MGKRLIVPALLILSAAMIFFGISVYAKAQTSVNNTVRSGAVKISISPQESHFENILPGQKLHVMPVVTNEGYDCYLRVRYGTDALSDYLTMLNIPEEWIRNESDGYWYYRKIVKSGETATVFTDIQVDPQMPQEQSEGRTARLTVRAEAVQSVNFSPDFGAKDPWNKVEAETFAGGEIDTSKQGLAGSGGLNVVYEGKADELIVDPDDFFSNLPVLMPGDRYGQKIGLKNESAQRIGLYFYTEAKEGTDLLEKISLKIRTDGKLSYYGTLSSPELEGEKNKIRLTEIPAYGKGECVFEVSVPESLKNEFTLKESSFNWIFLTQDGQKEAPPDPTVPPDNARKKTGNNQIQTGDRNEPGLYLILFGAALFVITAAGGRLGYRRRKEE